MVTGDLTGITEIVWNDGVDGGEVRLAHSDEDFDLANGVATLKLAGDNAGIDRADADGGAGTITIIVDGSTTLNSRTLNLAVNLDVMGDADDRELVSTSLTVWKLNGTVFLANFVNGNNEYSTRGSISLTTGRCLGTSPYGRSRFQFRANPPQWEQLTSWKAHAVVGTEYPSGGRCVDAHTGRDGAALHYRRW